MSPTLIQACNTTSLSQYDTTPPTYHTPFYSSTNNPVQPQYPEANINGDAAVTWDMNILNAGQIDEHSLHTEDDKYCDKENNDQYVIWNRSGFSLIRRRRSGLVVVNTPTPSQNAQGNHHLASLIHQMSIASIPKGVDQSQHLRLPTGAGVHPNR